MGAFDIEQFGGDSRNVMIFGESADGLNVTTHLVSVEGYVFLAASHRVDLAAQICGGLCQRLDYFHERRGDLLVVADGYG